MSDLALLTLCLSIPRCVQGRARVQLARLLRPVRVRWEACEDRYDICDQ